MKIFLPLCTALLLLAFAATLPVAAAEKQTASLREEMESLFQHLERKLSLQVEDAALATARQERRLTELENELKQLREEGESADAERRQEFSAFAAAEADKVKAASDRYTSLISAGFTALGALTAIVLAIPIFLGYLGRRAFDKESENKLAEMNQKLTEMETLVAKGHQHEQELKQLLQDNEPPQEQEKFSENITESAEVAVEKGVGVDALRGAAVLAQNARDWMRACLYWEDVIKQDSQDKKARFYLAQCRVFWGMQGDISSEQRILLWKQAEDFYRSELNSQERKERIGILYSYAVLTHEQVQFADSNSKKHLYAKAESLLMEAKKLAPQDKKAYILLAQLKLDQACDEQTATAERASLRAEAEQLLLEAKKLAPQNVDILGVMAQLKLTQADDGQTVTAERASLRTEAEQLLLEAKKLAPQDKRAYTLLAQLKLAQANDKQTTTAARASLRAEVEQLLLE
ncbi:hypothetical protein, partial [uncultured Desulfovibrio sp.]|uniref:hypothetical protein n=1 Tax=uncultured Desulfovibrio sp. TaxID=167968 RepID=UPI0026054158